MGLHKGSSLKNSIFIATLAIALFVMCIGYAWQHHPLFTRLIMETLPQVAQANPVPAENLEDFLYAVESSLATKLDEIEQWTKANLQEYAPCPQELLFRATGNKNDIQQRFFHAIRVNPNTKTPLYITGLAIKKPDNATLIPVSQLCILSNTKEFEVFCFIKVDPDQLVAPIDIIASASNEPDYGMDTGLFTDNQTEFGARYGFGPQPFGNPNLDFGSQAPFHMGFYHESPVIYQFAPFLKKSYVEYRIYLFKELAKFAFASGHPYWGYRFLGWGLHYLADLSMPYHSTALPGYSIPSMLGINFLDMIGSPNPKQEAIQLSSNRHLAIETFMGSLYLDLVENGNDPFLLREGLLRIPNSQAKPKSLVVPKCGCASAVEEALCIMHEGEIPPYEDILPRRCLAWRSHSYSAELDSKISTTLPDKFVNDPNVEFANLEERFDIVNITLKEQPRQKVQELADIANACLFLFTYYGKGYVLEILKSYNQPL